MLNFIVVGIAPRGSVLGFTAQCVGAYGFDTGAIYDAEIKAREEFGPMGLALI